MEKDSSKILYLLVNLKALVLALAVAVALAVTRSELEAQEVLLASHARGTHQAGCHCKEEQWQSGSAAQPQISHNYGGYFFPSFSPPPPVLLTNVHGFGVLHRGERVLQPKQLLRCLPLHGLRGVPEHWSVWLNSRLLCG